MAKKRSKQGKSKIFIFIVLFLGLFSYFQILPERDVKGIDTADSEETLLEESAKGEYTQKVQISIYKDKNKNAIWDRYGENPEDCLPGNFVVKVNLGKERTVKMDTGPNGKWCNPALINIQLGDDAFSCNKITFVRKKRGNYKVTGISYTDAYHYGKVERGKTVEVCGGHFDLGNGNVYATVDVGLTKRLLDKTD